MRLSMAAELAVRGVLYLAERYGQGPVTLDEICRRRNLPSDYMKKIFKSLERADIIVSIRGKGGGNELARAPKDIPLLAVIEAVEGRLSLNLCTMAPPKCDQYDCRVRPVWAEVQEKMRQALASKSLADVICDAAELQDSAAKRSD